MSEPTLNRDIALRIALAARAVPELSVARLLDILQEKIAGPLTAKNLKGITLAQLKIAMAGTEHDPDANLLDVNSDDLKRAVQALWGDHEAEDLPQPVDNGEPLPGAIRIAVASNNGEFLNGHFGSCARFLVYDMSATAMRLVDVRATRDADAAEDKNAARAELIADCAVLYMISIGGPAAAKVIRSGIYPLKENNPVPARQVLTRLQAVMAGSPPPWLAKILGQSPEQRMRFNCAAMEDEAAESVG